MRLRPSFFDARQNVCHDFPLRLRALRAAVVETHAHRAGFQVATAGGAIVLASRLVSSLAPPRSALAIFALNGVALKSASTRTLLAHSSFTMGRVYRAGGTLHPVLNDIVAAETRQPDSSAARTNFNARLRPRGKAEKLAAT
jgi:hypothetical protein